jgi:hypothetical protein
MSSRRAHADSRQGPRISILSTAVALACISLGNAVFAQNLAPVTVQSDWLGPTHRGKRKNLYRCAHGA